uniref:Uncharacterized protein n=1 Tax=Arundo donax TaxID=35708 RepID=A0A0A9H955_ARUDO
MATEFRRAVITDVKFSPHVVSKHGNTYLAYCSVWFDSKQANISARC